MTAGTAQIRRPRSAGHQSTRACGTVVLQESSGGRHRQSFSREGGAAGPDVPPGVGCFRAKTALAPPENCAHKPLARACASTVRPSQENSSAGEPTGREAHAPHVPGEDIRGRRRGHALGAGGGGNRRAREGRGGGRGATTSRSQRAEAAPPARPRKKKAQFARAPQRRAERGVGPEARPRSGPGRVRSYAHARRAAGGRGAPGRSAPLRARAPRRDRESRRPVQVYSWRARAGLVCAKQEARKHRGTKLRSFSLRD
ncbi:unnamed protein product [Prorocentrum cordatum]|uniref:Uncharacterized protein n=1 Tax=Prorocentrum cordatum TaxID=2364126 RepID=A0ABN9QZJ3_9DINO|nr:unnamed protein product [Polarella glacialis]